MRFSLVFIFGLVFGVAFALPDPEDAKNDCNQNDENGLGPVVRTMWHMVDINKVLSIFLEYLSEDPEMQKAFEYIQSDEMRVIVDKMSAMNEFIAVMEYICVNLKLNTYFYLNSLGGILGFPEVKRPEKPQTFAEFGRQPGIKGFFNEIIAVLPVAKVSDYWFDQKAHNRYVQQAIDKVKGDEFKTVAVAVEGLPEFQHMKKKLESVGFDMDAIIHTMKSWLGWV